MRRILDATTSRTQTILFSATLDGDVAHLVNHYQNDPVRHEVVPEHNSISIADHRFWTVARMTGKPARRNGLCSVANDRVLPHPAWR